MRNLYDVAFSPRDASLAYIPTNGPDDPAADDLLYATDVNDTQTLGTNPDGSSIVGPVVDDMGFPSCLYNPHPNPDTPNPGGHGSHGSSLEPKNNLNPAVIERFVPCPISTVRRPEATFGGHVAVSGLAFERGNHFPARYEGDLFVAEWGSLWNLKDGEVTGHKLMHVDFAADGKVKRVREWMTGALPIDVTFGPDGTMYVADFAGPIYRIQHVASTPDVVDVAISEFQFTPPVTVVPRGTTVRWTNAGQQQHTIDGNAAIVESEPFVRSGNDIDHLDPLSPGESHSYEFTSAGVWKYVCSFHPQTMHGTVVVLPVER